MCGNTGGSVMVKYYPDVCDVIVLLLIEIRGILADARLGIFHHLFVQ